MSVPRVRWQELLRRAAEIVEAEPYGMTLRGLFYRLVSEARLPNTRNYYSTLSKRSAEARRDGRFPDLIDPTRRIRRPLAFANREASLDWLVEHYRRDRTEGQAYAIYLAIEKNALAGPLVAWFDRLGLPVLALGGYASQTFTTTVGEEVALASAVAGRRTVLIYAGDFDPSGEDIDRDFIARVGGFDEVERVALTVEQVEAYNLPPQMGKATDSRAADFMARHGRLVQVELDALPLATLRSLYAEAVERYFDMSKFKASVAAEDEDRRWLAGEDDED